MVNPSGQAPFEVYCVVGLTGDSGAWAVVMVASAGTSTADTSSTVLDPDASATYSYMTIANFKSLVQIGTKMRAYGVSTPELYMECTADAADMNEAWTTDKNWQISDSCTISTSCTQSYTAPNRGFVYASGYDTINPSCGNSVFTKENAGTYSNGWHRSHSDDGGGWTSTYADRMVYIVK